jgi:hypothetical protein
MAHVFDVFGQVSRGAAPNTQNGPPGCAWAGCAETGTHKAPKSRARLEEYQWFCLDHVRLYNAAWNYYSGMSEAQVEANIRSDTTWNRPSWPFNGVGSAAIDAIDDIFGVIGGTGRQAPQTPQVSSDERRALGVLELELPVTFDTVKARYKELVKIHHPDANGGAKDAEERLKRINEAFDTLKNGLFAQA